VKDKPAAAALFDDLSPVADFALDIAADDWSWMQAHATREEYRPAKFSTGGETFPCHARFKGAYGSLVSCFAEDGTRLCDKLSMKVSFNEADPAGRFRGLRKLVFNSCNRDSSCLRERLAFALFRAVGIPAPRAVHARLSVNGEPAGLYLMVEDVDHEFLETRFDDASGNLYKEAWPRFHDAAFYVGALETNEDAADVSRMLAFAEAADTPPGATETDFDARVSPFLDIDRALDYLAVDAVTANWDGVTKFYCSPDGFCSNHNFYFYDDPASGRFALIPRDLDQTFNRVDEDLGRTHFDDDPASCAVQPLFNGFGVMAPQCDRLLHGLVRGHWDAYVARLADLTAEDGALSVTAQQALLDRYRAMIIPSIESDPDSLTPAAWRMAASQVREEVVAQAAEVAKLLAWTP
jgi:spore coat protein CotH